MMKSENAKPFALSLKTYYLVWFNYAEHDIIKSRLLSIQHIRNNLGWINYGYH